MDKLETMSAFFDARSEVYEEKHLGAIEGGIESKRSIAAALREGAQTVLDLGIGTGLELKEIYERFPEIAITGLDGSAKMLEILRKKYPDKKLHLMQENYLHFDFASIKYDAVISSMTMHHYTPEEKIVLYRKILRALNKGGIYIENDYILSEIEMPTANEAEKEFFREYKRIKKEQNLPEGEAYHFDTPLTLKHQIEVLKAAGFSDVRLVWQRKHNITLAAF